MATLTPAETNELLNGPALTPPAGQISNFHDPESLGIYVVPAVAAVIPLSSIALFIRLFTKRYVASHFGIEDYTTMMAWALLVGFCVPCVYCSFYGGAHQWNLYLKDLFRLLYYATYVQILYGPTVFFIKLSILLSYLRIFVPLRSTSKSMFVTIQVIIWLNFIFYTVDTFLEIFLCSPRAYAWNKLIVGGHCLNLGIALKSTGIFNVISDFAILLLPMYSIWKLNLNRKKKIGLCAIFGTGLLACITSILRLIYTFQLISSNDSSWNLILVGLWGIAETGIGFLCICLPSVPKFYLIIHPKILQLSQLAYGRSRTTTLPTTFSKDVSSNPKGGSKEQAKWNDPFDPRTTLNSNYIELEDWERNPTFEDHQVIISGRDPKASRESLEQGQIFQTVCVNVQDGPRKLQESANPDASWQK